MGTVKEAVKFGLAQIGKPYQWGSTGPNSWTCSSLVKAMLGAAGITTARTTQTQWATPGLRTIAGPAAGKGQVSWKLARPGDLLYFDVPGDGGTQPGHVGFYIGGGKMITAPKTNTKVEIRSIPTTSGIWLYGIKRPRYSTGSKTAGTLTISTTTVSHPTGNATTPSGGSSGCVVSLPNPIPFAGGSWCLVNHAQFKAWKGATLIAVGGTVGIIGFLMIASSGFGSSGAAAKVAKVAVLAALIPK